MAAVEGASGRRDVVIPDVWVPFYEETHIPAAVWSGNTLRLTGHTGEDADGVYPPDPVEQIRGTFDNIAITLAAAGVTWSDVVEIITYHVNYRDHADAVLPIAADYLDAPYPAWTSVGVTSLFPPDAVIEISCVAIAANRASAAI